MRFEWVLIYLPYIVVIKDYIVSYYTAQNSFIFSSRLFCRLFNACTSGARDDLVSSLNCDRGIRFSKNNEPYNCFLHSRICHFFTSPRKLAGSVLEIICEPLSYKCRDSQI